jgi:hypothetical protein
MKHTTPDALLTRELLCFVRDTAPTIEEFVARFGEQSFHILRKAGTLVVEDGQVRLPRDLLSADGQQFIWGIRIIHLDRDEMWIIRRGSPS